MQKIYSSNCYIGLQLRVAGKTFFLYLGRGKKYEGFWASSNKIPAELRIIDFYLEFFRKNLMGAKIIDIKVVGNDRAIIIEYFKKSTPAVLGLFWKGRDLFFLNIKVENNKNKILKSWNLKQKSIDTAPFAGHLEMVNFATSELMKIGLGNLLMRERTKVLPDQADFIKKHFLAEIDKCSSSTGQNKKMKFLVKKIKNIENDLLKVRQWRSLSSDLEQGLFEEALSQKCDVKLNAILFKFSKVETYFQRRDMVYLKIKKLKKGESILDERLLTSKNLLLNIKNNPQQVFSMKYSAILPVWRNEKIEKLTTRSDFIKFSLEKKTFLVGKNSQGNDALRNKIGKKDDLWFHLDSATSAHVILKLESESLELRDIEIAGSIISDYSNHKSDEINLVYTKLKDVKAVKGHSGKVLLKSKKHIKVQYLNEWRKLFHTDNSL